MADASVENRSLNRKNLFRRGLDGVLIFFRENMGILIGFFAICVFLSIISPVFLTQKNILNVLRQVSTNLYIAFAMTIIIILGGIDLSVGSVIALSGVVTGGLIAFNHYPVYLAIIMGILSGLLIGALNGFILSKTTIPPFIVTLATMNIARGAAYVYTGGQPIRVMSDEFNFIGAGYLGQIPMPIIYLVIILLVCCVILYKTRMGRHVYAVGGNRQAAEFSGIKVNRVVFFSYTFTGFLAAISGIVLASRMFSGQPTAGQGAEMDAIAAVVLGGTSMSGGVGKIGGTIIGGLVIGVLNNGLNLMRVSSFWQYIVKGLVILIAVYVDYLKKQKKG